jgi:hypothetical protein
MTKIAITLFPIRLFTMLFTSHAVFRDSGKQQAEPSVPVVVALGNALAQNTSRACLL